MLQATQDLPGYFNFHDIYREAVSRAPASGARFVEIGVMFGKSAFFMAETIRASGKSIAFDAVDKFRWDTPGMVKEYRRYCGIYKVAVEDELLTTITEAPDMRTVVQRLAVRFSVDKFVNIIESSGQDQSARYQDKSLDFVFIDALHTFDDTESMLRLYLPKMRRGGILAGHDYNDNYPAVKEAVARILGDDITVRIHQDSFAHTVK